MQATYNPGSLVSARGREWIVLPEAEPDTLRLRPLGGGERDETLIYLPLERHPVQPATFPWPSVDQARNHSASQMLLDALQLKLRSGAGPFRSFGNIAVEPRAYQLVPLLMALKQPVVRLLIADDVGIGNQRLIELGWEVKRFWVYDVRDSLDECVAGVVRWVHGAKEAA